MHQMLLLRILCQDGLTDIEGAVGVSRVNTCLDGFLSQSKITSPGSPPPCYQTSPRGLEILSTVFGGDVNHALDLAGNFCQSVLADNGPICSDCGAKS